MVPLITSLIRLNDSIVMQKTRYVVGSFAYNLYEKWNNWFQVKKKKVYINYLDQNHTDNL